MIKKTGEPGALILDLGESRRLIKTLSAAGITRQLKNQARAGTVSIKPGGTDVSSVQDAETDASALSSWR